MIHLHNIDADMMNTRIADFDQNRSETLRRMWFVGDVHGEFRHLAQSLLQAQLRPYWIVFVGDIDIDHRPFNEIFAPLRRFDPDLRIAFIHGNHDADSHEHWSMLHDAGDAVALHGKVANLSGVRVAGLGGHFVQGVWLPPAAPACSSKQAAVSRNALQFRGSQHPSPEYNAAIYADDLDALAKGQADILVTHEAPSCHPRGFEALDGLARSLGVARSFHGHHHDDQTAQYTKHRSRLGFDAVGLRYCQIKNGLGEEIYEGVLGW
ncbi:metallophosphoesterase family protein [Curvibacter fontanus]